MNFEKGIYSEASDNLKLENNVITSSGGGFGIHLKNAFNGVINNNYVTGQVSGIILQDAENVVLSSNSFIVNTNNLYSNYFFNLKNVSAVNNNFLQASNVAGNEYALYLRDVSDSAFSNNVVSSSSKTSLWISNGNNLIIQDNQIQSFNSFPALYVTSIKNSSALGNLFRGQPGSGAQISGNLSGSNFSNNIFEGNLLGALVFYGAAYQGYFSNNFITSTGNVPGITMHNSAGSEDIIFFSNQITSNQNISININAESKNNLFYDNYVRGLIWVSNYNSLNNFSKNGIGNRYYFSSGAGANSVFNLVDENGDHWADSGAHVPFSSATIPAFWIGQGSDDHPYTH